LDDRRLEMTERSMMSRIEAKPGTIVTKVMLEGLPDPVARYLTFTGVAGATIPHGVSLQQVGRMRSANEKSWMRLTAEETYTTDPPGFEWQAAVRYLGIPVIRPHDSYRGGLGRMQIKLARLFTLGDFRGEEMDQASLMRYVNEMVWFPTAFLLGNVSWEPVDDRSAVVTLADRGRRVSATMYFDEAGRVTNFVARRHRHLAGAEFSLDEWATPFTEYGEANGLRVPLAGRAEWRLDSGLLSYAELRVTRITYD
jgi:hypothetical protein